MIGTLSVTVTLQLAVLLLQEVPVIIAFPSPIAVIIPFSSTVTIFLSEDVHVIFFPL